MPLKTIGDLKQFLQEKIEQLDDYTDNTKLNWCSNTYFLENQTEFLATREGFINFDNPSAED